MLFDLALIMLIFGGLVLLRYFYGDPAPPSKRPARHISKHQELEKATRGYYKACALVHRIAREDPRLNPESDNPGPFETRFKRGQSSEDAEYNRKVLERWLSKYEAAKQYQDLKMDEAEEAQYRIKGTQ